MTTPLRHGISVILFCAGFASACSKAGDASDLGGFASVCAGDEDCGSGLFCARAGRATGTCTANCNWRSDTCPSHFGPAARCYNTECVQTCLPGRQDCGAGLECQLNPDHDPSGQNDNPDHHSCVPLPPAPKPGSVGACVGGSPLNCVQSDAQGFAAGCRSIGNAYTADSTCAQLGYRECCGPGSGPGSWYPSCAAARFPPSTCR